MGKKRTKPDQLLSETMKAGRHQVTIFEALNKKLRILYLANHLSKKLRKKKTFSDK